MNPAKQTPGNSKRNAKSTFRTRMAAIVARWKTPQNKAQENDRSYRIRLLAVYRRLKEDNLLMAEPASLGNRLPSAEELRKNPRLQAALAASTSYTPSKWLLEQELSVRASSNPGAKSWSDSTGEDVYAAAAREGLAGLCFSGGGIRSATFCLGIMQALAAAGKLSKFDYLSTVSGGGYIHQWLASWVLRESFSTVTEQLIPLPAEASRARGPEQITWLRRYSSYLTPQRGILSADTWTMIAIWFRNTFLNQIVLFSFLASCLLAVRALSYPFWGLGPLPQTSLSITGDSSGLGAIPLPRLLMDASLILFAIGSILLSVSRLWQALASVTTDLQGKRSISGALNNVEVMVSLVIPSFVFAILVVLEATGRITVFFPYHLPIFLGLFFLHILGLNVALTFGGQAPEEYEQQLLRTKPNSRLSRYKNSFVVLTIISAIFSTAVAIAPVAYFADLPLTPSRIAVGPVLLRETMTGVIRYVGRLLVETSTTVAIHQEIAVHDKSVSSFDLRLVGNQTQKIWDPTVIPDRAIAVFCPVLVLWLQFVAIRLQLGMVGRFYAESRREWLSRFGAWAAIVSVVWIVLCGIALLGPHIFKMVFEGPHLRSIVSAFTVLAVHVVTLYSGASGKSDGKPKPNTVFGYSAFDLIGIVGAPLCILTLLVIIADVIDVGVQHIMLGQDPYVTVIGLSLLIVGVFLLFGWRVDVNEFSMHGFYRNRLSRCYLGATNSTRIPDPFTHFDDHETSVYSGIALSDLLPAKFGGRKHEGKDPYDGPFPIFCSTINLTFGEDLGYQERKGASFAFTPLYTGYHVGWTAENQSKSETTFNGYVPTAHYAYPEPGIKLSTVAAISGAALSPNQGFSSNQALAFLMTLFNVRLGWWLANPRRPGIWPSQRNSPTPGFGIRYLLSELFGLSDDTTNYVCLCDGGFFENMGLYELVRRRCKLIVICDAEGDDKMVFEGIGNAIAKCRNDFGAEIDINLRPLIPSTETGLSAEYYRTGTITYPAPPGTPSGKAARSQYSGTIVYLKSTVCEDLTGDILHHKRTNPNFPQDSTLNQWFNESQFESYRRLGQLIAERASASI